jgi:hypothetical protein
MSKGDEKGHQPVEGITDLERVVTGTHQTADHDNNDKDDGLVAVETTASERLPFSKARCVALVTTIAAAPFLSVSNINPIHCACGNVIN